MTRLEFLERAQWVAWKQIESSSCETDADWEEHQGEIKETSEEYVLYKKARQILEDAESDIACIVEEIEVENE